MAAAKIPTKASKPNGKTTVREFPRTLAGTVVPAADGDRRALLLAYQEAVTLMQKGDFTAAHPALQRLLESAPPEFLDRIRMYMAACISQAQKGKNTFNNAEEQYDFAISLLNTGQYGDAREHLNQIVETDPNADYAFYGLALLASMTGDTETCLQKLGRAIQMNGRNRIQARSDSDFQDMADDPRFTELLYPEA